MVGFAILIMGRQIFWVFVAGLGFGLGVIYGGQFYSGQPNWVIMIIGTLIGILGALMSYYLQRLTGAIAAFATGWYLTNLFSTYTDLRLESNQDLLPIIVGVICAISIMVYFDWSAIVLSAFAGSAIIILGANFTNITEMILLIGFAIMGIAIQAIWLIQENEEK